MKGDIEEREANTESSGLGFLDGEEALRAVGAHMDSFRRRLAVLAGLVAVVVVTMPEAASPTSGISVLGVRTSGVALFAFVLVTCAVFLVAVVLTLQRLELLLDVVPGDQKRKALTMIGLHSSLLNPLPWFFAPKRRASSGYLGVATLFAVIVGSLYATLMVGERVGVSRWVLVLVCAGYGCLGYWFRKTGRSLGLAVGRAAEAFEPGMLALIARDMRSKLWLTLVALGAYLILVARTLLF